MITVETVGQQTLRELAGITYRQLDWWCRQGWLRDNAEGPGSSRSFNATDVRVATALKKLREVGCGGEILAEASQNLYDYFDKDDDRPDLKYIVVEPKDMRRPNDASTRVRFTGELPLLDRPAWVIPMPEGF